MQTFWLKFNLISDAAFSRGDGLAGVVDIEVQHDDNGCPYLNGRTIKGILVEECADVLVALQEDTEWEIAAAKLFGQPGSGEDSGGILSIGNAELPKQFREAIKATKKGRLDVLESLTTIRRQTAIEKNGVAKENSLRATRVILRSTPFEVPLIFSKVPGDKEKALFAACIKAFRRAGVAKTRGLGKLHAELYNESNERITDKWFQTMRGAVQE